MTDISLNAKRQRRLGHEANSTYLPNISQLWLFDAAFAAAAGAKGYESHNSCNMAVGIVQ